MKVVRRVREIGADGDGRLAVAETPVGAHDGGEGRDGGDRILERVRVAAEAEKRDGHAEGVHGRRVAGHNFTEDVDGRTGQGAPFREVAGEGRTLRGPRWTAV